MNGLMFIDMNTIYDELQSFVKDVPHLAAYHKEVLQDYQRDTDSRISFTYKSRPKFFNVDSRVRKQEFSFVCVAKESSTNELVIFYISEAYNINMDAGDQVLARFICKTVYVICKLEAIAEEPALAMASPTFAVEDAYLQYRKFNSANRNDVGEFI